MKTKTKTTTAIIALGLIFAFGSIGSFVNLTGIVHAYEAITHAINNQNLNDNIHNVAMDSTGIMREIQQHPNYCATNSC